jgi:hypothetical protein
MTGRIWHWATAPFRWIPWYVWLLMLAAGAWLGRSVLLIVATIVAFHPIPVPPLFQGEPESRAEAQLQDLRHFHHVRRNERSMTPDIRARFDARVADLEARAGTLTDAEFMLGLARAQAEIDNGHSNGSPTRMVAHFPRLPVRFTHMAGELRILRTRPGEAELLGARVDRINGIAAGAVMARFRDAFGGNDAFFETLAPALLDAPDYLAAAGAGTDTGATHLALTLADGRPLEVTMAPMPADPEAARAFPGDLPQPWLLQDDGWLAPDPAGEPLYLSRPERGYWMARVPGADIAFISLRTNLDDDSAESLVAFTERVQAELAAAPARAIVVDQRFSGGGDLTITHDMMAALPELAGPDGRVYLLTGGNTFSAAIVNLASAEEVAPERVMLVGEPIGDRMQFWAEGWAYELPNSHFRARYSTGFYDLQNGCHGLFRCAWGSLHIFPILVEDLDLDIAAPLTWDAYIAGRDPALEAVLAAEAARRGL